MMKDDLHLKYRSTRIVNNRAFTPLANLQKTLISKVMAKFFLDDCLLLSVDESSISTHITKRKCWQAPGGKKVLQSPSTPQTFSLLCALGRKKVESFLIIKGAFDTSLFEYFLGQTLTHVNK